MSLSREDAKAIAMAINGALGQALDRLVRNGGPEPERKAGTTPLQGKPLDDNGAIAFVTGPKNAGDFEELYQRIKRRLLDECRVDPVLVRLLAKSAPEIELEIEPRLIELTEGSLKGRIARLISKGFFDKPQTQAETNRELGRTGAAAHTGRLSETFSALVSDGVVTREGDGYQKAPGVKVTEKHLEAR